MKISKSYIEKLIKEELESILSEDYNDPARATNRMKADTASIGAFGSGATSRGVTSSGGSAGRIDPASDYPIEMDEKGRKMIRFPDGELREYNPENMKAYDEIMKGDGGGEMKGYSQADAERINKDTRAALAKAGGPDYSAKSIGDMIGGIDGRDLAHEKKTIAMAEKYIKNLMGMQDRKQKDAAIKEMEYIEKKFMDLVNRSKQDPERYSGSGKANIQKLYSMLVKAATYLEDKSLDENRVTKSYIAKLIKEELKTK